MLQFQCFACALAMLHTGFTTGSTAGYHPGFATNQGASHTAHSSSLLYTQGMGLGQDISFFLARAPSLGVDARMTAASRRPVIVAPEQCPQEHLPLTKSVFPIGEMIFGKNVEECLLSAGRWHRLSSDTSDLSARSACKGLLDNKDPLAAPRAVKSRRAAAQCQSLRLS
jgi:hypothetical protein